MRGTRYGDFSRLRGPTGDGAGDGDILMQQGRVQLDADWNAQAELSSARLSGILADLLGASGAPSGAPGFAVRPLVALHLDGAARAVVREAPALAPRPDDAFVLELWVQWHGGPAILIDWRGAPGRLLLEVDAGGAVNARRLRGDGEWERVATHAPLPHGHFAHVFLSWAADHAQLRVDEHTSARVRVAATEPIAEGELVLAQELNGLLGGLRVSRPVDRVLAWWPFDDGRSDRARDLRGGPEALIEGDSGARWRLVDLEIAAGRYYADGVLCSLRRPLRYCHQPTAPQARLPHAAGTYLAYLEVWEESVTAAQDPALREIALGGLDTAVRTRTAFAVRLLGFDSERPAEPEIELRAELALRAPTGRMRAEHHGEVPPGNYLYRVEVHHGGDVAAHGVSVKWSRRNGADVVPVVPIGADPRRIELLAGEPSLAPGDVVELLDAHVALDGPAPPLLRITSVEGHGDAITVDRDVPEWLGRDAAAHPFLRRWDQDETNAEDGDAPIRAGHWIDLEDGIRVQFAPGTYRRGDYWWVLARQDLGGIEWPREGDRAAAVPPTGVERRAAPLALLRLAEDAVEVGDLRGHIERLVAGPSPLLPLPVLVPEAAEDRGVADLSETELPSPDPEPPADAPTGGIPAGLAVVAPVGADLPGFAATGVELMTHRGWRTFARLDGQPGAVEGLADIGEAILLVTTHELVILDHDGVARQSTPLRSPRCAFRVCVIDGLVYLVGGRPLGGRPDGAVHVFDPGTETWRSAPSLPRALRHPAVAAVAGRIHVAGGASGALFPRTRREHWFHEPGSGQWTPAAPLPSARLAAAAGTLDESLHVVGGLGRWFFGRARLHRHDVFDPATGGWSSAAEAPHGGPMRVGAGDGEELVTITEYGDHCQAYTAPSSQWHELEPVPGTPSPALAALASGGFQIATGAPGAVQFRALPPSGRWTLLEVEQPV